MKKSLLNKQSTEETIARVQSIQPGDTPTWGTMSATEMLHHCYLVNKGILEGKSDKRKPSFKQRVMKTLFLYFIPQLPKHIKGPTKIDAKKSNQMTGQFDEEKSRLIETIKQFHNHTSAIEASHPFFGKLNTKQWGTFTWMHLDHHLRQFGV